MYIYAYILMFYPGAGATISGPFIIQTPALYTYLNIYVFVQILKNKFIYTFIYLCIYMTILFRCWSSDYWAFHHSNTSFSRRVFHATNFNSNFQTIKSYTLWCINASGISIYIYIYLFIYDIFTVVHKMIYIGFGILLSLPLRPFFKNIYHYVGSKCAN